MLTIRCAKCRRKLMKYEKFGTGKVLRCHLARIKENYTVADGDRVKCSCGNVIGTLDSTKIKMRAPAFTYSGTKIKT